MSSFKDLFNILINKNITISLAESCTGGKLCKVFTDNPGISKIFNMGLVTYSNKSKIKILKIDPKIIKKYGAVSKEIAYSMSSNLKKISKSKICISTTGIAGPNGGSQLKPIGLVYIGITFKNKTIVFKKNFNGNRSVIQNKTIKFCINEIKKLI